MKKILSIPILLFSCLFCPVDADEIARNRGKDEIVTFAGGCFWCVQHDFDQVKGVVSTTAGYTGGTQVDPTYKEVSAGKTGHVEAVQVEYDPAKVSYQELLNFYFHNIDPTRDDGQFCDTGEQYRPVIFYHDENQKVLAEKYKQDLIDSKKIQLVLVQILPAQPFYPAEEYHQEYAQKNPIRYKFYRYNCGRDKRLKELWGSKTSSLEIGLRPESPSQK
jgi:peptide-methionine (S)-S-oxide reductase